jgi:hypothetical protein
MTGGGWATAGTVVARFANPCWFAHHYWFAWGCGTLKLPLNLFLDQEN